MLYYNLSYGAEILALDGVSVKWENNIDFG